MVDKYRCYGKDDFGDPYDALSMKDPYGEWVRAEDYDALDAAATALGTEVQRLNMEMAAYRQGCTPADARAMLAVADALQAHKDSTDSGSGDA